MLRYIFLASEIGWLVCSLERCGNTIFCLVDVYNLLYWPHFLSVRSGERYAGPSLAVLGAVVFLLSLSLCMWLKISGKIIVLQSESRLLTNEDSGLVEE